jgi:Mitochondrial carrier protein
VISLVESLDPTGSTPIFARTAAASCGAALFRIFLLPIDAAKTTLQVEGDKGLEILKERLAKEGVKTLYAGAVASSLATLVGHYPWFFAYNYLSEHLPTAQEYIASLSVVAVASTSSTDVSSSVANTNVPLDPALLTLLRSAFIGLCASSLSDICSNSLRVLKTTRQTAAIGAFSVTKGPNGDSTSKSNSSGTTEGGSASMPSYTELAKQIIEKEGLQGLFGRGLQTRLLANALQGMLFSVLYKYFSGSAK